MVLRAFEYRVEAIAPLSPPLTSPPSPIISAPQILVPTSNATLLPPPAAPLVSAQILPTESTTVENVRKRARVTVPPSRGGGGDDTEEESSTVTAAAAAAAAVIDNGRRTGNALPSRTNLENGSGGGGGGGGGGDGGVSGREGPVDDPKAALTIRGDLLVQGDVVARNFYGERNGVGLGATLFSGSRGGESSTLSAGVVLLSVAGAARVDVPQSLWPSGGGSNSGRLIVTLTPLDLPMSGLYAVVAADGRGFTVSGGTAGGRVSYFALSSAV